MTEYDHLPRDTDPDVMRRTYRYLRRNGIHCELDAYEYTHVQVELERLGYTLLPDESDWQPPDDAR